MAHDLHACNALNLQNNETMIVLIGLTTVTFLTFGTLLVLAVLIGTGIKHLIKARKNNDSLAEVRSMDQLQKLALRLGFVMTFLALLFLLNFKVYQKPEATHIEPPDTIAHYIINITPPPITNVKQPDPEPIPEKPQKDHLEKLKLVNNIKTIASKDESKQIFDLIGSLSPPPEPIPNPKDKDPLIIVAEMPEFPGGEDALLKFVYDNFNYPEECAEMGITGKILIQFIIIEKDGSTSNPRIIKGIDCPEGNEEALSCEHNAKVEARNATGTPSQGVIQFADKS